MDIVVICNGLGNQMSQYAFYLRKKQLNNSTRFIFDRRSLSTHNGYELKRIFDIDYQEKFTEKILFYIFRFLSINRMPRLSKLIFRMLKLIGVKLTIEKPNYDYEDQNVKSSYGLNFYYGGWHSEKYFLPIENEVKKVFNFQSDQGDELLMGMLSRIKSCNSVSIHVRRGDFLVGSNMEMYGSVCTKEYFDAAIKKISSIIDTPQFFVFSNDVLWVKDNLRYENLTIVDFNKGDKSWKDMYLISNCKHNINSNSTFSWWGAWLNTHKEKIVITPKYYINNLVTKDFYPSTWLQITDY